MLIEFPELISTPGAFSQLYILYMDVPDCVIAHLRGPPTVLVNAASWITSAVVLHCACKGELNSHDEYQIGNASQVMVLIFVILCF